MLMRATAATVDRTMTLVGAITVLCVAAIVYLATTDPFRNEPEHVSVAIETPYIGQGVVGGSQIVMHGVEVGRVTAVTSLPGGGVQLAADLQVGQTQGLTDAMHVDFRPINYFGVTGVNIVAAPGGNPLRDGMRISTVPRGDFTLQGMLSRLGEVSDASLTPQLVSVIDRVARYADGLRPLLETMVSTLSAVTHVQTVPTSRLLANATGVAVPLPSLIAASSAAGDYVQEPRLGRLPQEYWDKNVFGGLALGTSMEGVFGLSGQLLSKYVDDLLPAIDSMKALTDPIPAILRPAQFGQTLVTLRSRLEKMFTGGPEQRALQVRIVLDQLPGVAAPLGAMGAGQ